MDEGKPDNLLVDILIVSVSLILTDLIGAVGNLTFVPWYKPLPSFITVLAVIFVCTTHAKSNPAVYDFGNVFRYGLKVAACSAVLVAAYTFLSLKFFFPGLKEMAIEQVRLELSKKDNMSAGTMESALSMTERMFVPLAVFGAMISIMLIALIGGMISYFFSKPFLRRREQ